MGMKLPPQRKDRTAAELLRQAAEADPEAHNAALARAYGVGPMRTPEQAALLAQHDIQVLADEPPGSFRIYCPCGEFEHAVPYRSIGVVGALQLLADAGRDHVAEQLHKLPAPDGLS